MTESADAEFQDLPIFDPREGEIILKPEDGAQGYWVGAPAVTWDASRDSFLLC